MLKSYGWVVGAYRILVSAQALSPCHSVTEPESLDILHIWVRWFHGSMVPWFHPIFGKVEPWNHGTQVPGYTKRVPWFYGSRVEPWNNGTQMCNMSVEFLFVMLNEKKDFRGRLEPEQRMEMDTTVTETE